MNEIEVTRREFLKVAGSTTLVLGIPTALASCAPGLVGNGIRPGSARHHFSGVFPHLAYFNNDNECGTGAVVPWAGRLWVITYSPHRPFGSTDKLYEIDEALELTARSESVGGTPANRMIHRESAQLFIGPYVIDRHRRVRVLTPEVMPGRLTGTARHLFDPAGKVYFATMEEGFYEVDVHSLAVKMLYRDGNVADPGNIGGSLLPGYHGKGLYTGQGRLVYANNGETGPLALRRPDIPSGALSEWDGKDWTVVRRNQFTEVTGPGGISGNERESDPVWTFGWDHRSAILMVRDGGAWHSFRMPKASHTYDGAHGWHTEWPRIREIGGGRMLMTMHGMFWDFPRHFSAADTSGIRPRSTYLKIIGDFCEWNGRVVIGSDDAARGEFARNPIQSKGTMVGRSNSNLWFVEPGQLDAFGAPLGRGGPWVDDSVTAGEYSDPFYFAGFERRMVHVRHDSARSVTFSFEVDPTGKGAWQPSTTLTVPPSGYAYHVFDAGLDAEWIRVRADSSAAGVTLVYQLAEPDTRPAAAQPLFRGLATSGQAMTAGVLQVSSDETGTLRFAMRDVPVDGRPGDGALYEVGPEMRIARVEAPAVLREMQEKYSPEALPYEIDEAAVVITDTEGRRWRLPKGPESMRHFTARVPPRTLREVVTERSILNAQGHLYELPRANSGGVAKIRPIATSDFPIMDFCSWRGLLVLAGVSRSAPETEHIVRSEDGACALWFGVVDDLWQLGKPRGEGGPWKDTAVRAGTPSDPYLMTGYDRKELILSHDGTDPVRCSVEVDLSGDGEWALYRELQVEPGRPLTHLFPEGYNAYWARLTLSRGVRATATFRYS